MKKLLVVFLMLGTVAANAQEAPEAAPKAAPGWEMPLPKVQMEMDSTLIPVGKGAVFVPAMTDPAGEPPYVVIADDKSVARTPTGQKTILPPGAYRVLVGSGVESQMIAHDIQVYEGHCTLIEPDWAGMVVKVVDKHGMQIRGTYELFALPDGEDFGLGLGADETRGETLRTWLLPPGRFMVVRSGETPRARTDYLTVRLLPGELVYFTLVQNEEDGSFMGGGVVDRGEGKTEYENWRLGLVVGGDLLWNRMDQVHGRPFGNSITINAFLDWSMRYLDPNHIMYVRLQIDEGQTALPDQELLKTIDEVDLDAIYTYRLLSWLGPYVRFGLDTNIFPGKRIFGDEGQDVVIEDSHGNQGPVRSMKTLRLQDPFDPLELKEGVGASFDLSPFQILDLHVRVGFGARQYLVQSLIMERKSKTGDLENTIYYVEVDSSELLGLEATLILSARLTRWLMIDTELDSLIPFLSSETNDPVLNWKNTISLRLVSFASLAYVVRLDFDKQLSEHLQAEQRILLRFTFDIL